MDGDDHVDDKVFLIPSDNDEDMLVMMTMSSENFPLYKVFLRSSKKYFTCSKQTSESGTWVDYKIKKYCLGFF